MNKRNNITQMASQKPITKNNQILLRRLPDLKDINPNSYEFKAPNEKTEHDYDTENIFD